MIDRIFNKRLDGKPWYFFLQQGTVNIEMKLYAEKIPRLSIQPLV